MSPEILKFEDFELDRGTYELRRNGTAVKLERIPLDLLFLLADTPGQLVPRTDIAHKLWGRDTFLDTDNSINIAIRKIRLALNDDPEHARFVLTVPGKGYRFIAPIIQPAVAEQQRPVHPAADDFTRIPPDPTRLPSTKLLWAAFALTLLLVSYFSWRMIRTPGRSVAHTTQRVMLVVLPFENLTGDPAQDYFTDGLTEETISDLGQLSPERLGLIARTSAMAYKQSGKSIQQIGQELHVDYVLESSARREGDRVRISSQLVRVSDQTHLWAKSYDRQLKDLLQLEEEIGSAIAAQVQINLAPQKVNLSQRHTPDPVAYDYYLRGRYYFYQRAHRGLTPVSVRLRQDEDFQKIASNFEKAIELDPAYAQGYTGLSYLYGSSAAYGFLPPKEGWPKAQAAALKAAELDSSLPEVHHALAAVKFSYDWDFAGAEREFKQAIELNPSFPESRRMYSMLLGVMGRHSEALQQAQEAEKNDPLGFQGTRATALINAHRYDQAIDWYRNILAPDEANVAAHYGLASAYLAKGMYKESVIETRRALVLSGNIKEAKELGQAFDKEGYPGVLQLRLHELRRRSAHEYVAPEEYAELYAQLGNAEQAFEWLNKAYDDRGSFLVFLGVNPVFNRLRGDKRFIDLLAKIGLPH